MPFRKRFLTPLLAGTVLLVGALLHADPPPKEDSKSDADRKAPTPSKLEEMLSEGLKNSPEIRVAAARVNQAEADLHRARLQVIQQVVTFYYSLEAAKAELDAAQKKVSSLERTRRLAAGSVSEDDYQAARDKLAVFKLKLEQVQAESSTLLGKGPTGAKLVGRLDVRSRKVTLNEATSDVTVEVQKAEKQDLRVSSTYAYTLPPGSRQEKLRKALETPIKVSYKKQTLSAIFEDLQKKVPGLAVRDSRSTVQNPAEHTFVFEEPLPVAAFLQAIEDELAPQGGPYVVTLAGNHPRFVVRSYGLLFTDHSLPPDAISVQDFLRQIGQTKTGGGK
jgi:hypothetical protein